MTRLCETSIILGTAVVCLLRRTMILITAIGSTITTLRFVSKEGKAILYGCASRVRTCLAAPVNYSLGKQSVVHEYISH